MLFSKKPKSLDSWSAEYVKNEAGEIIGATGCSINPSTKRKWYAMRVDKKAGALELTIVSRHYTKEEAIEAVNKL